MLPSPCGPELFFDRIDPVRQINLPLVQNNIRRAQMNLYVGNLSYSLTEEKLRQIFEEFGAVKSARLITDRETGRPRGFGFVEMEERDSGLAAIDSLHEKEIDGRRVVVNEAKPKRSRY